MSTQENTAQRYIAALLQHHTFVGLQHQDVEALLSAGTHKRFAAGETIYQRGDQSERGYVMLSGRVSLIDTPHPGKQLCSQLFSTGDLFAVGGFVSSWKHERLCVAQDETEVLAVTHDAFRQLLKAGQPAAFCIIDQLLDRFVRGVRSANQRLDDIHSRPDRILAQLQNLVTEPSQNSEP